jgi:hypothetical protein
MEKMTLLKTLLLGSAAGLVAASAQAADLPTRKGASAAEYVRVCSITVAGTPVVGFVLPGSDTCLKISGYVMAHVQAGNLENGRSLDYTGARTTQATANTRSRDSIGYSTRLNETFDLVSNTAYGPLAAHAELQFNHSAGFDNTGQGGSDGGLNRAYVTWAGLSAGKLDSFFAFTNGGLAFENFFSPDRKGFDQPDLIAYTAAFGAGFSATISAESPAWLESQAMVVGGNPFLGSASRDGLRYPDLVAALDVQQSWGAAHLGAVGHNVRASSLVNATTLDKWGWGVDAGVSFNIPKLSGAVIGVTGAYSRNAIVASGLPEGINGEEGAINGNGQAMAVADAFSNANGTWATPEAWSVTGWAQAPLNPQVTLGLEGSYGELKWTDTPAATMLSNSKSFIVGGIAHYDPVKNLDLAVELLYQNTTTDRPTALTGSWNGKADGVESRLEIVRSF